MFFRLMCLTLLLFFTGSASVHAGNPDVVINTLGMKFVKIPAGEFMMGTSEEQIADILFEDARNTEDDVRDETPLHKVKFPQAFYIGQTEVTQEQWYKLMKTKPGDKKLWKRKDWKQLPALGISWHATQKFIDALNKLDPKHRYRLPNEAEWEYAARAGNQDLRPFKVEEMEKHAWYFFGSNDSPKPVGKLKPNAFGLYDMYGNAWEWVNDWYGKYTEAEQTNPQGPTEGIRKIRRGGSYHCSPRLIRSAYRAADEMDKNYSVLGFRLVMEPR